jgi:uncharacterized membrane protein YGL010W
MAVFSVSDQFVNYYEYHQNKINQIIHFIFVPVLTFSVIMVFNVVPLPFLEPLTSKLPFSFFQPNLATLVFFILAPYYILLDFTAGLILFAELVLMYIGVNYLHLSFDAQQYWTLFAVLSLVGWGTQFFGHGYFEGRRPALFDNLLQVFIAPLFVMLEALFAFGYKPALRDTIEKKLQQRNASKKAK